MNHYAQAIAYTSHSHTHTQTHDMHAIFGQQMVKWAYPNVVDYGLS